MRRLGSVHWRLDTGGWRLGAGGLAQEEAWRRRLGTEAGYWWPGVGGHLLEAGGWTFSKIITGG